MADDQEQSRCARLDLAFMNVVEYLMPDQELREQSMIIGLLISFFGVIMLVVVGIAETIQGFKREDPEPPEPIWVAKWIICICISFMPAIEDFHIFEDFQIKNKRTVWFFVVWVLSLVVLYL